MAEDVAERTADAPPEARANHENQGIYLEMDESLRSIHPTQFCQAAIVQRGLDRHEVLVAAIRRRLSPAMCREVLDCWPPEAIQAARTEIAITQQAASLNALEAILTRLAAIQAELTELHQKLDAANLSSNLSSNQPASQPNRSKRVR